MSAEHRFKDEWIVRAVLTLPGITSKRIDEFRQLGKAFLSQSLVQSGVVTAAQLGDAVLKLYKIPFANIANNEVDKLAIKTLPERICQKLVAFPTKVDGDYIVVAMANPLDMDAQRDLQILAGRTIIPHFCLPDMIQTLIAEFYSGDNVLKEIESNIDVKEEVEYLGKTEEDLNYAITAENQQPVIKLANSLIAKAVMLGASDIHIEHDEKSSYVRYRIDGVLKRVMNLPKSLAGGPLISRIKIMANMDIADHNRPQDGGAKVSVGGKEISMRVSTLPTNYGEKAVIRLLDTASTTIPFEVMGFPPDVIARFDNLIRAAQGIILVTGPTGSGKTTTLYTALAKLKSEDTNIVTVEDPIEYKLQGINQVQVNEKAGMTFSAVLRSVLRQDPDVILIGEIRDAETANIAFQAAITGHIVFSTLHTNDSLSAISRLYDMGVERFKLAPGILAVTAQRLVRRLCKDCRVPITESDFDPIIDKLLGKHKLPKTYFKPKGCEKCAGMGYKGRLAVVELLELNSRVREGIAAGETEDELRKMALEDKMLYPMMLDILSHLTKGDTSAEEIAAYLTIDDGTERTPSPKHASTEDAPEQTVTVKKKASTQQPVYIYEEEEEDQQEIRVKKRRPPARPAAESPSVNLEEEEPPQPEKRPVKKSPPPARPAAAENPPIVFENAWESTASSLEEYGEIALPEPGQDAPPPITNKKKPQEKPAQQPPAPLEIEPLIPDLEMESPSAEIPATQPEPSPVKKSVPPAVERAPEVDAPMPPAALPTMKMAPLADDSEPEQTVRPPVPAPIKKIAETLKPKEITPAEPPKKPEPLEKKTANKPVPEKPAIVDLPANENPPHEPKPPEEILHIDIPETMDELPAVMELNVSVPTIDRTPEIRPVNSPVEPVVEVKPATIPTSARPKKAETPAEPDLKIVPDTIQTHEEMSAPGVSEPPVSNTEETAPPKKTVSDMPDVSYKPVPPSFQKPPVKRTPAPAKAEPAEPVFDLSDADLDIDKAFLTAGSPIEADPLAPQSPVTKKAAAKNNAPPPADAQAPQSIPPKTAARPQAPVVPPPTPAAKTSARGSDFIEPVEKEPVSKNADVMIVDGNAALRLLLRCILEDAGFTVTEAKDGAHAMEVLLNKTPDVMLVDINSPKLSAEEVIKRVRQGINAFPIIVLTSNSDDKSQVDTLSMGADDYIMKPLVPSVVLARVRAALRRTGK